MAPEEFVNFDARQRQAAVALDLLAELSQSSAELYDLRRVQDAVLVALYNPTLAAKAVAVLANLTRPKASGRWSRWPAGSRSRLGCGKPRPRRFAKTEQSTASC